MRASRPPVAASDKRTTTGKTSAPRDGKDKTNVDDDLDIERTPSIDSVAEKRLVRKLDLMIIPPIMLLYLLSFLDRVNIGNARLYGLEEDLGMAGNQYQTAVSLLFVTYILSELPSNLVIKKFKPSRWIAFITTSWGIIATCTGAVQSYAGLIICRLFLGAVEGGLFPGCVIYLTLFYNKRELALRVGYLFVSAALAGGLGGLLGYAIGNLDGHAGLRAWRWIMIIEGLPTLVLVIVVWWWLADDPETAYYLTPAEKELLIVRKERQVGYSKSGDEMRKEDVMKGLKDWKVYVICVGQFGMDTMLYGQSSSAAFYFPMLTMSKATAHSCPPSSRA
jgi:MFS family permease